MTCVEKSDLIWLSTENITEFWKAFHNQLHFSVIWKSVCAVCKGIERLRYLNVDWKTIFLKYWNICACSLYSLLLPKSFLASLTEKTNIVSNCFYLALDYPWKYLLGSKHVSRNIIQNVLEFFSSTTWVFLYE